MNGLLRNIERILRNRRTRRMLQRTISMFAAIVVFFTTYALVLPAITMEKTAGCGIEEHQHDDSCYEDQLICGLEESEEHQHTADCYERVLVCGKEAHTHSAACYPAETEVEVDAGVNDNAGNTDDAGDGVDTSVETTEGGKTEVPASDFSDTTVVIDPSDPSGQVTDGQAADPVVTEDPAALVDGPAAAVAYPAVIFDDTINVLSAGLNTDTEIGTESGLQTLVDEASLFVHVEADEETFPEGTTMVLSEVTDDTIDTVATAVEGALSAQDAAANAQQAEDASKSQTRTRGFHALDISFYDLEGNKIEPLRPVRVSITSDAIRTAVQDETTVPVVVHVEDVTARAAVSGNTASDNRSGEDTAAATAEIENAGTETAGAGTGTALNSTVVEAAETTEAAATGRQDVAADAEQALDTLTFEAGAFSVYAIVYTVDFHWEVDGKNYDFSIPGGGYVSLYDLVKDLGIAEDKADTEKDEIQELVDGVETVAFSNQDLVSVSKAEENTTVGAIKDGLGLECEYSADLTEEQIAEINAQEVMAGDWALISLKPFDTEESMNVTMINGETWTVKVTDAQIKAMYLTDSGKLYEVTVAYGEDAGIPDGSTLEIIEVEKTSAQYKDAYELVSRLKKSQKNNVDESVSENIGEVEQKKTDKKEDDNSDSVIIDTLTQIPVEMDVLDISIFDKKHESVEPKAPVKVSIIRKDLPEGIPASTLESTLAVNHLNDHTGEMTVETVVEADGEPTDGIDVEKESVQVEFFTDSFSTYTISWGGGLTGTGISSIPEGQYIIYAHDAANGNYYALLPKRNNNGTLNTVQLTNTNGVLSYSGDISNLYWTYSRYNNSYRFSFQSGYTTYYLSAGSFGVQVSTNTNGTSAYGNANTTLFGQYNDHLHTAGDTFLRCYNGIFQFVHDVSSGWENRSQVFFAKASETKNVAVHYGYMDGNTFVEFSNDKDGDVPAGTVIPGPTQYGEQWDLEKTIPGYRYVTTRLNNPTNGREISSLLNTDPPYKANENNTFENANQSAYPSYTSSTAPTSFVSEWRYRQLSSSDWNPTGNHWNHDGLSTEPVTGLGVTKPVSFAESDKDIYVIYEKGSMSGGSGGDDDTDLGELNAPKTDKQVQSNQDGTYDVTLSAKGEKRDSESSTKANVVVILDTSWSMYEKDAGDGKSRLSVAKSAIGSLADKLFALNAKESDTIELAFVNFAQRVRNEEEMRTIYSGTNATSFKNMINGLDCAEGTNWDDALYAANHIYFNDNDPTYIVFVTDGDPISCAHPYGKYDDWDGGTYYTGRSNYEYALAAKKQADLIVGNNKTLYTIGAFGEISNLQAIGGTYLGQANNTAAINGYFDKIISDIESALGYQDITINDGITALSSTGLARGDISSLRYYRSGGENANGSEKYDHTANDGHGVEWIDAPDAYLLEVKSENGVTKYYKNGTAVSLNSLTDLTEQEYLEKYPIGTRTVIWDISLGGEELLEDGVTYTMIFTMWPSQEAYDLIADLNNKTIDYKDLSQAEKDQVYLGDDNVYYLKTNTKATVDYKSVKLVNGEVSGTPTSGSAPIEDPKGKMNLDTSVMTVRKDFAHLINEVDPYEEIVFYLLVDGKYYNKDGTLSDTLDESKVYAMNLPKDGKWEDTIYIAPGLMRGGDILETGHNYSLEEKIVSGNPYEYEFAPQTVRPMVITAVPTFLVKKDTFNTNQESKKEYTFNDANSSYIEVNGKSDAEGTYYAASENNGSLVGVNHKTSELDITKIINDPDNLLTPAQEASDTFTYRVTLQIPDGCDPSGIVGYEYVPRTQSNAFTLFGYQTGQSAFAEDIARFNGKTYRAWNTLVYDALIQYERVTENGKTVIKAKRDVDGNIIWKVPAENGYHTITYDMTLKQDEVIRFTNLPTGTKYKVQEIYANKYPADNAGGKTDGRAPVTDAGNLTAEGYAVEKVQHTGGILSADNTTVEGTIEAPDTRYYNQFTNKKVTEDKTTRVELKVKKEVEDYTWGEEYYRFTLAAGTATYTDSTGGSGKAPMPDGEQNSAVSIYDTTPDHTLSFGMIRYSRPGTYTYTVTEYDNSKNMPYVQFAAPVNLTVTVTADNAGKLTVTKVEDDKGTTVYSAENGFVIASGLTTQTNTSKKIYLKKVDKNNPEKVLSDALFEIKSGRQKMYLQNGRLLSAEDVERIIEMSVSAESADKAMEEAGITSTLTLGEIGISGFVYDTVYGLKELSAPDGYVITSGSVYFKAVREDAQVYIRLTDQNGNILIDENSGPVLDNDSARVSENGLSIAIKNEPGAALPNTGGPGTRLFTILGTALIAGAGILLWMSRKSADFTK